MNTETCEIRIERVKRGGLFTGGDYCRFYADVIGPRGRYVVGRSEEFICNLDYIWNVGNLGPYNENARRIILGQLDSLVERLARDGWEPLTPGKDWWSYRFRRPLTG